MFSLLLAFTERNPGITRILTGDALAGEPERLRARVAQFFDRIETHLKQALRDAEIHEGIRTTIPAATAANLLLTAAEGRICQFVRSEFKRKPTDTWQDLWSVLTVGLFKETRKMMNTNGNTSSTE